MIQSGFLSEGDGAEGHDPVENSPVSGVTQPFAGIPDVLDVTGAKTPLTYCYYMTFSVEQNSLDFCTMPNGRFGSGSRNTS
jgi:hypothetical protein